MHETNAELGRPDENQVIFFPFLCFFSHLVLKEIFVVGDDACLILYMYVQVHRKFFCSFFSGLGKSIVHIIRYVKLSNGK